MVENAAPSEAEFRAWMAQYGPGLRRYFQRRADPAEADDLVQEVFLAMHRRVDQSPIGNVQGYLFRVAAGVLSKRPAKARADLAPETFSLADELSPERRLLGREALERLVTALQALPPRARQAFTLHRFEEMTYAAIAVRMGVSVSAIEQLISRASERLTAAMEERP
ncbi:MAG TPA: sigma-70 family RNA polymerase sigma factor [Caulobacteraceae bacterium]|nr:sigma-70 family RNA polymerase sigma factor [Caulobacteraceae bacterium]